MTPSWPALALAAGLLLAACGGEAVISPPDSPVAATTTTATITPETAQPSTTTSSQPTTTRPERRYTVATAVETSIEVFGAPEEGEPDRVLQEANDPSELGGDVQRNLVFLVKERGADWLEVYLPVRPNGSTGWVRRGDVHLASHDYRIEVYLSDFRIKVFNGDEVLLDEPIGVGTADTPTPGGVYYIKELLRPPDPDTVYGVYAYGLSGFSNVFTSFAGGEGVIGIHGTNAPHRLGSNVSAGCIRMHNDAITRLVEEIGVPLGTPVEIIG